MHVHTMVSKALGYVWGTGCAVWQGSSCLCMVVFDFVRVTAVMQSRVSVVTNSIRDSRLKRRWLD